MYLQWGCTSYYIRGSKTIWYTSRRTTAIGCHHFSRLLIRAPHSRSPQFTESLFNLLPGFSKNLQRTSNAHVIELSP